ncbi:MAG: preprotein translocase subunit SecA [Gemmatimonadota bacterium]|nr:MAG: preprotein translocase subunit SecA [Gemmatimonadota bacterium]
MVTKVIGTRFERELKRIQPIIDAIKEHEKRLADLSDDEIQAQTGKLRGVVKDRLGDLETALSDKKAARHACADPRERDSLSSQVNNLEDKLREETAQLLDELLPEAFATVREACRRLMGSEVVVTGHALTWDMVPYDVQLIGGLVLHQGKIAEMATGEGKTLVATLPLYLNALPGRGCHLVTVNDYLARRDSEWMGHLFKYLGLTVGCLDKTDPSSPERRAAYECDITYGTNNEFGFDYLRDNMVFSLEQRVQREHVYAIIDEVDSILIDEARTPLIISGPVGKESDEEYAKYNGQVLRVVRKQTAVVNRLVAEAEPLLKSEDEQYEVGVKLFKAQLGMPKNKRLMKLLQEGSIKQLVQRVELDRIADRKLPAGQQRFREIEEELYFVMDEKGHSVHLTDMGVEEMSPGDPTLFVVPDISEEVGRLEDDEELSTEEKLERRAQLEVEYANKSQQLHIIHKLLQAHALYEKDVEYVVQDGQVFIVDEFTGRIMHGRRWSDGLHQSIEAKEGVSVRGETQTLATITIQNYFRMYEKLSGMTGTAETEETEFFQIYKLDVMVIPTNRPVRRVDNHDLIYKTRREKYNSIVEEVERQHERGLPVLVGTATVEVSETLSRMFKRRGLKHEVLNAKQHQREAEIVANAGRPGSITIATNMAGRGTDIKLGPKVKQCDVCAIKSKLAPFGQTLEEPDIDSPEMKRRGCMEDPPCGLAIVGTERHESRRIDRQLRGRSGRQGDPGQSVFFLSLEDDLMRLFGSERIAKIMDKSGAEEGEVITHPLVTRAIENAQKRVELQNFQARKRLLEYDDVMNQQREVVYSLRLFGLEGGEEMKAEAIRMIEAALDRFTEEATEGNNPEQWDRDLIATDLLRRFLISAPDITDPEKVPDLDTLSEMLKEAGRKSFEAKLATWDELGSRYNIERLADKVLSHLTLRVLDEKWKDHLFELDHLRSGIYYRSLGQKDPLVEYKKEAFEMFVDLLHDIRFTFSEQLFKHQVQVGPPPQERAVGAAQAEKAEPPAPRSEADLMVPGAMRGRQIQQGITASHGDNVISGPAKGTGVPKVGRNEPCPCGSGKKYKKCHGRPT